MTANKAGAAGHKDCAHILSSVSFDAAISTKINQNAFDNIMNAFGEVSKAFGAPWSRCVLPKSKGAPPVERPLIDVNIRGARGSTSGGVRRTRDPYRHWPRVFSG